MFTINLAIIALVTVVAAILLVLIIAKVNGAHYRQVSTERKETPISVLPKTSLGIWSVGLVIAFILLFFLIGVLTGSNTFVFKIIWAGVPGAVIVTGLFSMIKRKERSVLVLFSMVVGLWFLIAAVWHLAGGE